MKQVQLDLMLSGFDLPWVLLYFESATMYRWYPEEIAKAVKSITPNDQALIDHYRLSKEYLWYKDEIIADLKKMIATGVV